MTVISRSTNHRQHWPGMNAFFGNSYDEKGQIWNKIFDVRKSKRAHEEIGEVWNFGLAGEKPEGEPHLYDTVGEGNVARFAHCTYALAYTITEEAQEDNLYASVGKRYSKALGRSMRITKEIVAHSVLNNAFDTNYRGADGQPLISAAHSSVSGGTQSNQIAVPADLSEVALEDIITQVDLAKDQRGLPINMKAKSLIIPPQLQFEACRILDSAGQSYTDGNNINVIKSKGLIPEIITSRYLTDPDAFFIKTDIDDGLILFNRVPLSYAPTDRDFNTGNHQYRARERYSVGYADWRQLFGSPGA